MADRKQYQKQYREANKEKFRQYSKKHSKKYYEANKDAIKQWQKEWGKQHYQANKEELNQKTKQWQAANQDKVNQYREKEETKQARKKYNEAHRDKLNQQARQRYETNRANVLQRKRLYREANKGKVRIWNKRYRAENPEVLYQIAHKRRAVKRNATIGDTKEIVTWLRKWQQQQTVKCFWCSKRVRPTKAHADHIEPLSKGGAHSLSNLCVACAKCNLSKGAKDPAEWNASLEQPLLFVA